MDVVDAITPKHRHSDAHGNVRTNCSCVVSTSSEDTQNDDVISDVLERVDSNFKDM